MRLFDLVPGNFFSILSSGNREIYYDALMILHDMFKFELNIDVGDYLSRLNAVLEDRTFELEYDDECPESSLTSNGNARLIMGRLIYCGWIDREFIDGSFIEIITPRSYAIPVLRWLSDLSDDTLQEYNSLVFATFSGLKQAMNEDHSHLYEALLSAKANTEQLQYALRTLYHGIRGFMRDIVDQQDVNILLQDHFGSYMKLSDQIYHPIKTMDSVHRYRLPIHTLLTNVWKNDDLMQVVCERAMSIKNYDDADEAKSEIVRNIDYILNTYQTVGDLVSEIDRKHSAYTRSSIEKIQYLMTADQTIKGKLAEILKTYAGASGDKREQIQDIMQNHIQAGRHEFFDERSLYHKNVRSRRIHRDPLVVEENDSFADIGEEYLLRHIGNGYPVAKVRSFIERLFEAGENHVAAKDIPITGDSDFILIILAVIRQGEIGMPYTVEMKEGRIEQNGYQIPNMVIHKKEVSVHVE